ncbi:MAG: hypothetical protein MSIBF_05150 [Candidatus Altiarchaeales archaeon IMC4]|nr:MAG: hypothetical protein MSIBF_05150 [Candidatus Altiarchaeales archaeon IMC4]
MSGAIGGAALGIAFGDKKKILCLSLAGAIGFLIGFAIGNIIEYAIIGLVGFFLNFVIIGATLGAALGIALWDKKKILYLSLAGAIGGAIGAILQTILSYAIKDITTFPIWLPISDLIPSAIGGATIGWAIAYLRKNDNQTK